MGEELLEAFEAAGVWQGRTTSPVFRIAVFDELLEKSK
jgi:hypothetical protein